MLKLYDFAESVCCQKVRLAIAEKGDGEVEECNIALDRGEQFSDWFLKLNPKGVVPVLVHNSHVITESTIISEYLNSVLDGASLMPDTPHQVAKKQYWSMQLDRSIHNPHTTAISFIVALRFAFSEKLNTPEKVAAHLSQVIDPLSREMQRQGFELGYDAPAFREAVIAFNKLLSDMEDTLAETPWLCGEDISLADLDLAPYIHRLDTLMLQNFWSTRPHVSRWLDQLMKRDSWKRAIQQKHDAKWLELMSVKGQDAWPKVEAILNG